MKIGLFLICLTSLYNQATCSQFNENLLISTSYPLEIRAFENLYETIQLEIWSFYVTNWNVISYPYIDQQPFQQISKTQLIFLMKNIEDGEILGLLYNDVITYESVLHCIQVNDMMMKVQQITSAYEGSWIVNVITIAGNIIQYETFGASQQLQQQQKQQFELKKYVRKILCFVGGSTIINKEVYGVFKGRLSKLMVNSYQLKNIVAFYYERIQQLRAYEQEYTISLIPDLVNFDGVIQKEFSFEQFGRKFSIHGWVKYYTYDAYYLKKYLLVRLTTFKNYQDEIDLGDEILKITVDLDLINTEKCGYDLISHHYWMPYPQQISGEAQQDKISLREDLPYLEILSKWHFISFEHGLNNYYQSQFILGYYDDQELRYKTYYLGDAKYNRLFINTKYYAIFGGDYTVFEKMKGQLSGFYFKSNYGYDLNLQINCHYSCQTCNGPLFSNCLTCQNERVFLDESHQCVCPLGQFEKDKQCKTYSDLFSTVDYIETKLVQSNYQCPFGYFNLPTSISSQCIKCPQWNSYNLLCVDCILNSTNWYKKPICTTDFVTQQITQDKDAYRQQQRSVLEYDLYYIDNNYNLILLEGVYDFCDITKIYTDNCIDLGIQHLQTSQFGFCKQNRFYFNFGCYLLDTACVKINKDEKKCLECLSGYYISEDSKSCLLCPQSCINCQSLTICQSCESGFGLINQQCQRCGKFCKTCQYSSSFGILQCLSCIDNHKYYLSLNAQDCKINEIDNCIYAFETSESDVTINSLDYNFQPYYQKTVTKCAKCEDGYYFHDSDLICVQGYWKDCQQYFVRIQGIYVNYICLFGPYSSALIYSFSDQCPRLKLHCIHCVIEQLTTHLVDDFQVPKKASYTCLVCQNGYYADKRTGQCQLCPTDLNCLTCIQQNRFTKDHWKIHIRAFYRAAIDLQYLDHKFIIKIYYSILYQLWFKLSGVRL